MPTSETATKSEVTLGSLGGGEADVEDAAGLPFQLLATTLENNNSVTTTTPTSAPGGASATTPTTEPSTPTSILTLSSGRAVSLLASSTSLLTSAANRVKPVPTPTLDTSQLSPQLQALGSTELVTLENIQAELDKLQESTSLVETFTSAPSQVVTSQLETSVLGQNAVSLLTSEGNVRASGVSGGGSSVPTSIVVGQIINDQMIVTSQPQQLTQFQTVSSLKRPITATTNSAGSGQSLVTKVIITKNPLTNQPQAVPSSSAVNQQTSQLLLNSPTQTLTLSQASLAFSPTKTVAVSQTSLLSPTKLVSALPTTPKKQIIPAGKIALSPVKSPTRITMVPISGRSPQRIAPAPGQLFTMVAKTVNTGSMATTTVSTVTAAKTATITMSPSKMIIKQQPTSGTGQAKPVIAQQLNLGNKLSGLSVANLGGMQPLSVSGSKFQYVRLVAAPSSHAAAQQGNKMSSLASSSVLQAKPIVATTPAVSTQPVSASQPHQMKITLPVATPQQPQQVRGVTMLPKPAAVSQGNSTQRLILPANSQMAIRPNTGFQSNLPQLRPAGSGSAIQQLPPGATIIQAGQNIPGVQGFALVPAQYVTQFQQVQQSQPTTHRADGGYIPIASSGPPPPPPPVRNVNGSVSEPAGQRPRKPCNCTKSQCLKLYCDCFANGEFCHNCNCHNCANNLDHEDERSRAIKACLDRNPHAFHPKIGKGKAENGTRRHNKGCNCKRSGCLKNYCECYEAKILCSSLCKCVGCKNFEESPDRKTLMHLADAAEVRVQQQTAAKTKLSSQIEDVPHRPIPADTGERLPYTFVTREVAEATCACLVAQAEEAERTRQLDILQERMILEEFGRCLMQVIESSNRTKAPSPVP